MAKNWSTWFKDAPYGIPILQKDISLIIAIFLKKTFLDMTCLLLLETVTLPEEDRAAASGPQKLTKGFKRPKRGCLNWNPNAMSNEICQETHSSSIRRVPCSLK